MIILHYRNALPEDLPDIVDIYNSTIPGRRVTADTELVTVSDKLTWFNEHNPLKRPLLVVETGGVIIGWLSFQSFYGRAAYDATAEISIYLAPGERGKGIGKSLLKYALNHCHEYGIKNLVGYIFEHNMVSLKLYQESGFEDCGTLPGIAVLDGIERTLKIVGMRVN